MKINVYLPDELGHEAKAAGLQFSRLLRSAVIEELERLRVATETSDEQREFLLDLRDDEGRAYTGRLVGKSIAREGNGAIEVFVTNDGRIFLHETKRQAVTPVEDPESELREALQREEYVRALFALGRRPTVDL